MKRFLLFYSGVLSYFIFLFFPLSGWADSEDFSRFHMPVSNPVYNGDPRNVTGFIIPFDGADENTLFYDSWHASYALAKRDRTMTDAMITLNF